MRKKPAKKLLPTGKKEPPHVAPGDMAMMRQLATVCINSGIRIAEFLLAPCCAEHGEAYMYDLLEAALHFGRIVHILGFAEVRDIKDLMSLAIVVNRPPDGSPVKLRGHN